MSRPGKWGNPVRIKPGETPYFAVACYRDHLREHPELVAEARTELRGKNLACWCKLTDPCHADVLLEIANQPDCNTNTLTP